MCEVEIARRWKGWCAVNADTIEAKHYILRDATLMLAFAIVGGQRKYFLHSFPMVCAPGHLLALSETTGN